jgi:hypothetical protein
MKNRYIVPLISLLLFVACNNNKSASAGDAEKDTAAVTTTDKTAESANTAMDKQKEDLEKLSPVSLDELKAMLPETYMGGSRTSLDANSNNGASLATAEYAINDSMQVIVNVFDCAGPGGAGIFTMQFQNLENAQQETADEYTKAITVNGNKGYEHCDKVNNDCTITYFTAKRYLVVLEGKKVGAPALRAAAGQLLVK